MTEISFNQLRKIKNDGIVFYGLVDELKDFQEIINNEFNTNNLGAGSFEEKFNGIYEIITQDGRRDIVLEFCEKPNINMGRLAIWRLQLNGLASWISDYVVNRRSDFELAPLEDEN